MASDVKKRVWIDCDPGVDDAVALILADYLYGDEIAGVSAVAGNSPIENTWPNANRLKKLIGASWPVYKGAAAPLSRPLQASELFHGKNGLGNVELPLPDDVPEETIPAHEAIYRAALEAEGELTLISTGPLTDVALLLQQHPDSAKLIRRLLMMGGAAGKGNVTPYAEYNVYADPEAADVVFRSGMDIVMFGLDVTLKSYLTPAEIDALAALGTEKGKFARDAVQIPLSMNPGIFPVHDACPVLYYARPELFSGRLCGVRVDTEEPFRGRTETDLNSAPFGFENAVVMQNSDRETFVSLITDSMR